MGKGTATATARIVGELTYNCMYKHKIIKNYLTYCI